MSNPINTSTKEQKVLDSSKKPSNSSRDEAYIEDVFSKQTVDNTMEKGPSFVQSKKRKKKRRSERLQKAKIT